tara:strand:+ start:11096 stop:11830 length:735 start_codon:yes stop_codon:yes gene_type:complete
MLLVLPSTSRAQDDNFASEMLDKSISVPEASERLPRPVAEVIPAPEVPQPLDSWKPLTLEILVKTGATESLRTVTRTNRAVHVQMPDKNLEWRFARNPVDPLRVSGQLVKHGEGVVLDHNDNNLRDRNIARGWVDVMTIGLTLADLDGLEPTGETRKAFGLEFVHLVRPEDARKQSAIDEVWWHEDSGIPLQIVASDQRASWEQSLVNIRYEIDDTLLRDAAFRYPEYRNVDLIDFGEEFHEFH